MNESVTRIGIIADTHGLLRPEVLRIFAGVDPILPAGDVGGAHVLEALRAVAPLTFVGGNNDEGSDGHAIIRLRLGRWRVLLTHILPKPSKPRREIAISLAREPAD